MDSRRSKTGSEESFGTSEPRTATSYIVSLVAAVEKVGEQESQQDSSLNMFHTSIGLLNPRLRLPLSTVIQQVGSWISDVQIGPDSSAPGLSRCVSAIRHVTYGSSWRMSDFRSWLGQMDKDSVSYTVLIYHPRHGWICRQRSIFTIE